MRVLGLHTVWHDTGACLIDGERLVAVHEERLSRVKYDGAFPSLSIQYVLEACGLTDINQVDLVVFDHIKDKAPEMEKRIRAHGYRGDLRAINHHDAHAAAVFYQSPFDDAAILVVDGTGSMASWPSTGRLPNYYHAGLDEPYELHSYYRGHWPDFTAIDRTVSGPRHRGSIGMFYDAVSLLCDFGPFGAGKVMGLAAYGGKDPAYQTIIWNDHNGHLLIDGSDKMIDRHLSKYTDKYFHGLEKRTNQPLPYSRDTVPSPYTELAYQAQLNCERAMVRMAEHLHRVTGSKNLCICGGVGLNSISNWMILQETPFENLFIHPACSDTGIPIGAALYGWHVILRQTKRFVMKNAYLGREYTEAEIVQALKSGGGGYRFEKSRNVAADTAGLLASGKILGWHQGGSEVGPRALGHRSILSDPRPANAKDVLNERVKHREWWRPFAPSILIEHYHEYFDLKCPSPYMLLIAPVAGDPHRIPAAIHVDGTARVQTVTREENGLFYELIAEFHRLTGTPVVLNTSFNVAGEPIVETPADALRCMLQTHMDNLIVGDYIVTKS